MADVIHIEGVDKLDAKLREMGSKAATKYARGALRPAARIIQREAKALAPLRTGKLRDAIRVLNGPSTTDSASVYVGPSRRIFTGNGWYARFQELGWFSGKRAKRIKDSAAYQKAAAASGRKFIQGRHYMETAFDNTRTAAEESIGTEMVKTIQDDWES